MDIHCLKKRLIPNVLHNYLDVNASSHIYLVANSDLARPNIDSFIYADDKVHHFYFTTYMSKSVLQKRISKHNHLFHQVF